MPTNTKETKVSRMAQLIVVLDVPSADDAERLIDQLTHLT